MKTQEKHKAGYLQYGTKYRNAKGVAIASKKKEFRMGGFFYYFVRSLIELFGC